MSTSSIDPAMLATVKEFVELLKHQPSLIFTEDLKFLRDYLSAVGAKVHLKNLSNSQLFLFARV